MSATAKTHRVTFTAESVRAILAGRKTVTRRLLAVQPEEADVGRWMVCEASTERGAVGTWAYQAPDPEGRVFNDRGRERVVAQVRCPYGSPGDRLAVREAWRPERVRGEAAIRYAADDAFVFVGSNAIGVWEKLLRDAKGNLLSLTAWRSPFYLPAWASRITLNVAGVRVERLHEINDADVSREGVNDFAKQVFGASNPDARRWQFERSWDEINGKRAPWASNPWVWRVEFARVNP